MAESSMFVWLVEAGGFGCILFLSTDFAVRLFGLSLVNANFIRSSGHAVCECLCSICKTN